MRILFVCSGNVFRSLSAQLAVAQALPADSALSVSSAGTHGGPHKHIRRDVKDRLEIWNADHTNHTSRLLTRDIVESADLIVAMGTNHRDFIRENFGRDSVLFMEVCCGISEGLPDVDEVVPDYKNNRPAATAHINKIIDLIFDRRHDFAARLPSFLPGPRRFNAPRPS